MTGLPRRQHADFPPHPTSAAEARRHVRAVLTTWHLSDLVDTAQLLVSELITNALKTTTTSPVRLTLDSSRSHLVIEVRDPDPIPPTPRDPFTMDEGGRGLFLVETLAEAWGHRPASPGKTVWCVLPASPEKCRGATPEPLLESPGASAHEGTPEPWPTASHPSSRTPPACST
ncbi:hypothetical protein GCM10009677_32120 [Sphaerisporangium rubeum]|uniref:ATP-binding protein n=1 Tax=Sphaerisporangium rubeum TaxID=321317 RepID=UPI00160A0662